MLKNQNPLSRVDNHNVKKRTPRIALAKRARSNSPTSATRKSKTLVSTKRPGEERRCQSLSPSHVTYPSTSSITNSHGPCASSPEAYAFKFETSSDTQAVSANNDVKLPHSVMAKLLRNLSVRKREFIQRRKSFIQQQNSLLEQYATLRELLVRVGAPQDEFLGEVRLVSVTGWPAHDLMLLVRDDVGLPCNKYTSSLGMQMIQQLKAQLDPIPEEMLKMGSELMERRLHLLDLLRSRHGDRSFYTSYNSNMEWKNINSQLDQETETLYRMVEGIADNLKAKVNYCLELAKVPWVDRETMAEKTDRMYKENITLQHKHEELSKIGKASKTIESESPRIQELLDELSKEKSAREDLKNVVSAAEGMLRGARARVTTLERQLTDARAELDNTNRKHKQLEQLYRQRETCFDSRSKKLLKVSKFGEATIETLSQQRDALELRVKELHELAKIAEREGEKRTAEERARSDSLQSTVSEQEKCRIAAENQAAELKEQVKELEGNLQMIREKSMNLVNMEKQKCLEYIPSKESNPSDRETEIWKEMQLIKSSLSRAEEEVRQCRSDKENLLNSLARIAQEEGVNALQDKLAIELLDRERKITEMQRIIDNNRENEKQIEQTMLQYESMLASLRLEVRRLQQYDCYSKASNYQEMQTELLELQMQVEALTRERASLINTVASRTLMLERHERAEELFTRVTRARIQLAAVLDVQSDPPALDDSTRAELSRSLSSMCANAASTWSALRAERTRVLQLESTVLEQNLHQEKEGRVRTQLERRRAMLERKVITYNIDIPASVSRR